MGSGARAGEVVIPIALLSYAPDVLTLAVDLACDVCKLMKIEAKTGILCNISLKFNEKLFLLSLLGKKHYLKAVLFYGIKVVMFYSIIL